MFKYFSNYIKLYNFIIFYYFLIFVKVVMIGDTDDVDITESTVSKK